MNLKVTINAKLKLTSIRERVVIKNSKRKNAIISNYMIKIRHFKRLLRALCCLRISIALYEMRVLNNIIKAEPRQAFIEESIVSKKKYKFRKLS